jgi:adenylate cyclase class 2
MIEIERKFRLSPVQGEKLETTLQQQYGPLEPIHQIDEVFLHGTTSFALFEQGMPVTRLRTVNGETMFTYKRRIDDAGDMIEHELRISSADTMRSVLTELGYMPVTVVDKVRLEAKLGDMTIMYDQVEGLGDFCEIEIMAQSEASIPDADRRIMAKAVELGLTVTNLETGKYDLLIAQLGQKQ